MYAAQRWTGGIAFAYIIWHTYTMRFTGTHLLTTPDAAFDKVQIELQHWWAGVFYLVGIIAASWHFSYGIYLFCAKWGITVSEKSRKWYGPRMYGAGAHFDSGGMGNHGGVLPAAVERPLEEPPAAERLWRDRALRINHKGHEGTQRTRECCRKLFKLCNVNFTI